MINQASVSWKWRYLETTHIFTSNHLVTLGYGCGSKHLIWLSHRPHCPHFPTSYFSWFARPSGLLISKWWLENFSEDMMQVPLNDGNPGFNLNDGNLNENYTTVWSSQLLQATVSDKLSKKSLKMAPKLSPPVSYLNRQLRYCDCLRLLHGHMTYQFEPSESGSSRQGEKTRVFSTCVALHSLLQSQQLFVHLLRSSPSSIGSPWGRTALVMKWILEHCCWHLLKNSVLFPIYWLVQPYPFQTVSLEPQSCPVGQPTTDEQPLQSGHGPNWRLPVFDPKSRTVPSKLVI